MAEKTFNRYMPMVVFLVHCILTITMIVFGTFSYEGERYDIYGHMRDNTKGFVVNLFMNTIDALTFILCSISILYSVVYKHTWHFRSEMKMFFVFMSFERFFSLERGN